MKKKLKTLLESFTKIWLKGSNNEHTFAFVCCFIQNSFRGYNFPISKF